MRKSFVAAVAIAAAITVATPAAAAPRDRDRDRSQPPSIVKYVKDAFSKVFKVKSASAPIIPIPDSENGGKP